jgi:CDP-glycerol glycerophosphotransferase (TagB/SpsB family)
LYIETIANAIENKTIEAVNFIVRTSPAEDPKRFEYLTQKYSFIQWNFPVWKLTRNNHQEPWSQRVPSYVDGKDLRALLEYSDLNINMLSTMSLDFMQFDKPVINTVFGNTINGLYDDQRFLKFAHIMNVVESNATKIVFNKEELISAINHYVKNPKDDSENRKQFVNLQVGAPLEGTSKRIVKTLLEWSNQ